MIPSSGWLSSDIASNEPIIAAPLPVPYIITYRAGSLEGLSVLPGLIADSHIDGAVLDASYHGLTTDEEYGFVVTLTVLNAYFAALVDTLTISAILSSSIFDKETCPDVTEEDTVSDDIEIVAVKETCPDVTEEAVEPALPPVSLTSFEACCGVLNIPLCDGSFLADGSIFVS